MQGRYDELKRELNIINQSNEEPITEGRVIAAYNYNNEVVVGVTEGEKTFYLHSLYNKQEMIDAWVNQQNFEGINAVVFVAGLADGSYVNALRVANEKALIVVYEPLAQLYEFVKDEESVEKALNHPNTLFLLGDKGFSYFSALLSIVLNCDNYQNASIAISPNYDRLFSANLRDFRNAIYQAVDEVSIDRNTVMKFGKEITMNIMENLLDNVTEYNAYDLCKGFQQLDLSGVPAIVVAAGPSLDKNIHLLKEAKNKAFIIATDSALNSLAKHDICPDVAITVDSHKPVSLFANPKMSSVPLVYHLGGNYKIRKVHTGKRFYFFTHTSWMDTYSIRYAKPILTLESGGSVANDAYSLALAMGFRTVIFIGLDLAYPNNQEHASGTYASNVKNTINTNSKRFFSVPASDGGTVLTEENMDVYRRWFEKQVVLHPAVKHIDATEGGAKKNGMEIMTLCEALEKECTGKQQYDFTEIVNCVPMYYTLDEQREIMADIARFEEYARDFRKRLRDGSTKYEKLREYNRKQTYSGKGFESTVRDVSELNEWVTNSPEMAYLALYTAKSNYEVRDSLVEQPKTTSEEIDQIVSGGLKLIEAQMKALDVAVDQMQPNIERAKNWEE